MNSMQSTVVEVHLENVLNIHFSFSSKVTVHETPVKNSFLGFNLVVPVRTQSEELHKVNQACALHVEVRSASGVFQKCYDSFKVASSNCENI